MKKTSVILLTIIVLLLAASPVFAASAGKGQLFYDGNVVRTVVPPAAMPKPGIDDFYVVTSGAVDGQLGIAAVAPGDQDYHGGKWAFHSVTWTEGSEPSLLMSEYAVLAAEAAGDVTITRVPENDFKCPIQP
jgi:hypothetical protein